MNASIAHGYYGWQGDKERLELVPGKAGVTFSAPPSAKALADTAGASSDLYLDPATPSKALDAGSRHGARTFVYEFAHPLVKADHGETLRTLREQPGVLAANPVFKSSSGRESLLTDYIYVSFPIDTPEERIFELFAEDGLEIVRDETYERIGERGFRLRLGPSALAKADPTRGAMDLANRYHDNPLTSGATPMFAPLYDPRGPRIPEETIKAAGAKNDPDMDTYGGEAFCDSFIDDTWAWHLVHANVFGAWDIIEEFVNNHPEYEDQGDLDRPVVAILDDGIFFNYKEGPHETLAEHYPGVDTREDIEALIMDHYGVSGVEDFLVDSGYTDELPGSIFGHPIFDFDGYVDPQWINPNVNWSGDKALDFYGWDFTGGAFRGDNPETYLDGDPIPYPDKFPNTPEMSPFGAGFAPHATGLAALIGGGLAEVDGVHTHGIVNVPFMPLPFHVNLWGDALTQNNWADVYSIGRATDAVRYAYQNGARVIAASIGHETYDLGFHNAIREAHASGAVIVVPATHANTSSDANPEFPEMWPEVITVGAAMPVQRYEGDDCIWVRSRLGYRPHVDLPDWPEGNPHDPLYMTSTFGWSVDVVAPVGPFWDKSGIVQAYQTSGDSMFLWGGGNSSSFPQVAALAAMILVVNPDLTPSEVQYIIQESADYLSYVLDPEIHTFHHGFYEDTETYDPGVDLPGFRRNPFTGHGLINMGAAIEMAIEFRENPGMSVPEGYFPIQPGRVRVRAGENIQDAIDQAIPGTVIEVEPGVYGPIDFGGKDVVVRSTDPYDLNIVNKTVIDAGGWNAPERSAVQFSGAESSRAAIIGFTIRGGRNNAGGAISGRVGGGSATEGTLARVMYNRIYGNAATEHGGAIAYCHGRIEGNEIGHAETGKANRALNGGAIAHSNGIIRKNFIHGNIAGDNGEGHGGAIYQCHGYVEQNYIVDNAADYGGGLSHCHGIVQANIIAANHARNSGGGVNDIRPLGDDHPLYTEEAPGGVFEFNTVYGNTSDGAAGGRRLQDMGTRFRNNVFWGENDETQLTKYDQPYYSAIKTDEDLNPHDRDDGESEGNIGPFEGTDDLEFDTATAERAPSIRFLHLTAGSPLRNAGDPNTEFKRDFDDQLRPVGPRPDIGADEYPTLEGMVYWWNRWATLRETHRVQIRTTGRSVVAQGASITLESDFQDPDGDVTYQWRRDGVDIPDATGPTLTIPEAAPQDSGHYTVVVTDDTGTYQSPGIGVTVWERLLAGCAAGYAALAALLLSTGALALARHRGVQSGA